MLGLCVPVLPVAILLRGWEGLAAAAAAAVFCLAGATIALVVSHLFRRPKQVLAGMLLGMAARMGIPLGFGLACHLHAGALAQAGLLYYLLVFYPVTLGIETVLSLPHGQKPVPVSDVPKDMVS